MESLYVKHIIDRSSALAMARDERLSANDLRTFLAFWVLGLKGTFDDALIAELAQATKLTPGVVRGCILTLVSFGHISFTTSKPSTSEDADAIPSAALPTVPDTGGAQRKPAGYRGLDPSIMSEKIDLLRLKSIGDASARDAAALRDARANAVPGLAEFRPLGNVPGRAQAAAGDGPTPGETPEAAGGLTEFRPVGDPPSHAVPLPAAPAGNAPKERILGGFGDWNPVDGEAGQPVAVRFSVWLRFVLTPAEFDSWELWTAASPGEWANWAGRYAKAKATGDDKELLQALRRRLGEVAKAPPIPGGPGSVPLGPAD